MMHEILSTPVKESNATRLWSIISFILDLHKVRYPWKACSIAFQLMPYLLGLFHWGVCRVSKLGEMSKRNVAKLIGLYGKCTLCHVLCFPFVSACMGTQLPILYTKILRNKTLCWISNNGAIWNIYFLTLHLIKSLCARSCQTIVTNNESIERKINRLSKWYLTWWI